MADSDIDMPTAAAGRADRLLAITLELNRMRNPDALLDFIIETAADVLGCEATSILLVDDATDQLHFAAATGANPDSLAEIPVPLNDSIAGTIFTTNAPLIIDDTAAQRAELTTYLEEEYRSGRLAYGVHVTDRALVTCVVFERMGRQVHFVDGADGGYAMAARALKQRLRAVEAMQGPSARRA